jgi:hypothetical protein
MDNIDYFKEEALRIALDAVFGSALVRKKFPKCYSGAPARRKAKGARGRKAALYASMTGIKRLRFGRFNRYVRTA